MALGGHPRSRLVTTLTQRGSQGLDACNCCHLKQGGHTRKDSTPTALPTKDRGFSAGSIALAEGCAEDYGRNCRLRTRGGSRGRLFPLPPDTGVTEAAPRLLQGDDCQPGCASSAVPHVARKILHRWGARGVAGGDSHTQLGDLRCSRMMK